MKKHMLLWPVLPFLVIVGFLISGCVASPGVGLKQGVVVRIHERGQYNPDCPIPEEEDARSCDPGYLNNVPSEGVGVISYSEEYQDILRNGRYRICRIQWPFHCGWYTPSQFEVEPIEIPTETPKAEDVEKYFAPTVTPTSAIPTRTTTPRPNPTCYPYEVKQGDRLVTIASEYQVSVEDIVSDNNMTDPNLIHVGQVLQICYR